MTETQALDSRRPSTLRGCVRAREIQRRMLSLDKVREGLTNTYSSDQREVTGDRQSYLISLSKAQAKGWRERNRPFWKLGGRSESLCEEVKRIPEIAEISRREVGPGRAQPAQGRASRREAVSAQLIRDTEGMKLLCGVSL